MMQIQIKCKCAFCDAVCDASIDVERTISHFGEPTTIIGDIKLPNDWDWHVWHDCGENDPICPECVENRSDHEYECEEISGEFDDWFDIPEKCENCGENLVDQIYSVSHP